MYESFYGGRTGISFVIVKRFDAISLDDTTYQVKEYATTSDGQYYIYINSNFIEKTADNYTLYTWGAATLDGSSVETVPYEGSTTVTSHNLPEKYAEGMVQCFIQGGDSTDVVNYGEYVVIDTIAGLGQKTNPDNGKVFRRGMNYDGELGGAEYIGQFIGATGDTAELFLDSAGNVIKEAGSHQGVYEPKEGEDLTGGLIPGRYYDEEEVEHFNDDIHYAWMTIRDSFGNITGSKIGFTFPYLIEELHAEKRSPYYVEGDPLPTGKQIGDLIEPDFDFIEREDDASHPFYQQWRIHLPKGIKGDEFTDLKIYNSKVKENATYYADIECTLPVSDPGLIDPKIDMSTYIQVREEGQIGLRVDDPVELYVESEDTWGELACYTYTVYDNKAEGEKELIVLGEYNVIDDVNLRNDGILEVTYSYNGLVNLNEDNPIRWIKYDATQPASVLNGFYIDPQGNMNVRYNTNELETQMEVIPWIKDVELDSDTGILKITFNNNSPSIVKEDPDDWGTEQTGEAYFHKILDWVKEISIASDGTVKYKTSDGAGGTWSPQIQKIPWITGVNFDDSIGRFTISFNNDELKDTFAPGTWDEATNTYSKSLKFPKTMVLNENGILQLVFMDGTREVVNVGGPIKWILDVKVNTGEEEGSGSQKIEITYNVDDPIDPTKRLVQEIGEAINYVVDAQVASPTELNRLGQNNDLAYHLLVYYSDPVRREDSTIEYPSARLGKDVVGWIDMGLVRGEAGGLHIIGNCDDISGLSDAQGAIPPERWEGPGQRGTADTPEHAGWAITVGASSTRIIYIYDYYADVWIPIGSIDDTNANPLAIVSLSDDNSVSPELKVNGLRLRVNTMVSVE